MTGTIAVIMIFSIPIIAIVSDHLKSNTKQKAKMLATELEIEKVKQQNFIAETEKVDQWDWCPEPESNRHARNEREILSLLCLPISPSGRDGLSLAMCSDL